MIKINGRPTPLSSPWFSLTFALCFIGFLSACTSDKNQTRSPQMLRVQISKEPPTMDWNLATDMTSRIVIHNIMDTLVDIRFSKSGKMKMIPLLAESWISNEKKTEWKFILKSDIRWSDGEPLTASHVRDSFERLLNPKTGSFFTWLFYVIEGAEDYNKGVLKDFSKVGISISDSKTVSFQLKQSDPQFPKLLTLMQTIPVRKDLIKKYGDNWTKPENLVTLGPFLLKAWQHNEKIYLTRNPQYHGEKPSLREIELYILEENSTALNLFDAGKLDVINNLPLDLIKALRQKKTYFEVTELAIEYLSFNVQKHPFDQLKVRKSLSQAIDRKQITELIDAGFQPTTSFLPFDLPKGVKETSEEIFNVKEAKANFSQDIKSIDLHVYTDELQLRIAQNIQSQLKNNLGIKVNIKAMEFKSYLRKVNSTPPGFYRLGWMAIYPDPSLLLGLFTSNSHFNTSGWTNHRYDKLVQQSTLSEGSKRSSAIEKADFLLTHQEYIAIPLYTGARQYLISEKVENYPLNPIAKLRYLHTSIR